MIWFCIPSIRPGGGHIPAWKKAGYAIAIVRQGDPVPEADLEIPVDRYQGWARSINIAVRAVLMIDPSAQWIVSGGDDTLPDPRPPAEIAAECTAHFKGTFGVMQPIGDLREWPGSLIQNFAGSPWIGREWCRRAYGGNGPVCDLYHHQFADEELQQVAMKFDAFWQRSDLIHRHEHPLRKKEPTVNDWPYFLKPINTPESWNGHKLQFENRRAAGWPGSDPLAV